MAIEYSLVVDTTKSPAQLLTELAGRVSFRMSDGSLPEAQGEGIVCTALAQSQIGRQLINETFHIWTSVAIHCRINKFERLGVGMAQLVKLCTFLIQAEPSDFILLANAESGILLRKDGKIEADCRDDYWNEKWSEAFGGAGIPFTATALSTI